MTPCRRYLEELLWRWEHRASGFILQVGGGHKPYREILGKVINTDLQAKAGVDVVCDLRERFPFRDAAFDSAVCLCVLEHLPDPWQTMAEVRRVLRDGGDLVVFVPLLYPVHNAPRDYWRFTPDGLSAVLDGFEVEAVVPIGGKAVVLAQLFHQMAFPRCLRRLSPLFYKLARVLERWESTKSRTNWALGYFVLAEKKQRPLQSGRVASRRISATSD